MKKDSQGPVTADCFGVQHWSCATSLTKINSILVWLSWQMTYRPTLQKSNDNSGFILQPFALKDIIKTVGVGEIKSPHNLQQWGVVESCCCCRVHSSSIAQGTYKNCHNHNVQDEHYILYIVGSRHGDISTSKPASATGGGSICH